MAAPVWLKVRKELGHKPIVEGRIDGATPLYVERYLYHSIERSVSGLSCAGLVTQFGGGRVREGERGQWRNQFVPTQSLLVPPNTPTHWHYSGTVDFAVFYLLDGGGNVIESLRALARSRDAPIQFSDQLVGAAARQLVNELHKGPSADEGFMGRLAEVMLEQTFRALTTPGTGDINPRHLHFSRLQAVLNHIHHHPTEDLSASALARRAGVSLAHFRRLFQEAVGMPPHRYVLAARLEQARKLLTLSEVTIAGVAQDCGFASQSHLTASFRAAHAVTPAQFRKLVRRGKPAASAGRLP